MTTTTTTKTCVKCGAEGAVYDLTIGNTYCPDGTGCQTPGAAQWKVNGVAVGPQPAKAEAPETDDDDGGRRPGESVARYYERMSRDPDFGRAAPMPYRAGDPEANVEPPEPEPAVIDYEAIGAARARAERPHVSGFWPSAQELRDGAAAGNAGNDLTRRPVTAIKGVRS